MRTFLVKRVMKPRRTAKTSPTRVPPMLTMRKEAEEGESAREGVSKLNEVAGSSGPLTHSLQVVRGLNVPWTHFHEGDVDLIENLTDTEPQR